MSTEYGTRTFTARNGTYGQKVLYEYSSYSNRGDDGWLIEVYRSTGLLIDTYLYDA